VAEGAPRRLDEPAARLPSVIGIAVCAALIVGLQAAAIVEQSLTADEPYHLLAGYQALRYGQNTLNLEHPPLVKLVGALPLLLTDALRWPPQQAARYQDLAPRMWHQGPQLQHARVISRFSELLTFGVAFLLGCYWLGYEVGGRRLGLVLALVAGVLFDVVPFLASLQTDTGVAAGFLLTLAAALRWRRRPGLAGAVVVGAALGLALATKFSGVLILPSAAIAFLAPTPARDPLRVRIASLLACLAVGVAVLDGTYWLANRNYDPQVGRETIRRYCDDEASLLVGSEMRAAKPLLLRVERRAPMLAQWLTGMLGVDTQNRIGVYPAYAFGHVSSRGWWWYFPVLLLVKIPLAIVAATALALVGAGVRQSRGLAGPARSVPRFGAGLVVLTVAVYLGVAMWSKYNIGYRHLLPITPLVCLPACVWAARTRLGAAFLVGALAAESVAVAPLWVVATNTWFLGRSNPTRFAFTDSSGDYGQDFVALAREAKRRRIATLHVAFPVLRQDLLHSVMPSAVVVRPDQKVAPGWYAVSVIFEQYVPGLEHARPSDVFGYDVLRRIVEEWRPTLKVIGSGVDHGYAAGTFHLYFVPSG
jgi:hypothetical protein